MKRCPACHRFGVVHDERCIHERCLWRDCHWVNIDDIDVDKVVHPIRFQKFINAITRKTEL